VTKEKLSDYHDKWVSEDEEDSDDPLTCDNVKMEKDKPSLFNLKQVIDHWTEDSRRRGRGSNAMFREPLPTIEKVYEIVSRESIHREQVFTGFSNLE